MIEHNTCSVLLCEQGGFKQGLRHESVKNNPKQGCMFAAACPDTSHENIWEMCPDIYAA